MIALFTDFGLAGPYVGQMHAVFAREGVAVPVIDLMHDAPRFDASTAAHLLAALAVGLPAGTVFAGVVDPGVGTARAPVVVAADGRWFVGPANGLFNVVAARADEARWWRITRAPEGAAATFHGRDLFAPVAAAIARGEAVPGEPIAPRHSPQNRAERAAIIYIDAFGNAVTGLRASVAETTATLTVAEQPLACARTFGEVETGEAFWFINSMGLVEIAVNQGRAADQFGVSVGTPVHWSRP